MTTTLQFKGDRRRWFDVAACAVDCNGEFHAQALLFRVSNRCQSLRDALSGFALKPLNRPVQLIAAIDQFRNFTPWDELKYSTAPTQMLYFSDTALNPRCLIAVRILAFPAAAF